MTVHDLCMELWAEYAEKPEGWDPKSTSLDDFDPIAEGLLTEEGQNTLALCYLLREADRAGRLDSIEIKYQIEYHEHFIGYTYITRVEYVVPDEDINDDGTADIPDELVGKVVPVVDIYEDTQGG